MKMNMNMILRILFALALALACVSAIHVHYPDGIIQVVDDNVMQEMHIQASFMTTTSVALRYSQGIFITIQAVDGQKYFRSLSDGVHKTPTVPELRNKRDRYKPMTFSMSLLPKTLFIYRSTYKTWVHVADNATNVISPVSLGNGDSGTWTIQPYDAKWVGVYGMDGVFVSASVGGVVKLSSPGISFITLPPWKCIQLWLDDAKVAKVCDTGPHVNVVVTGISVVDPDPHPHTRNAVEGTANLYVGRVLTSIIVDTDGVVLTQPLILKSVQVPSQHMMKVEDDEGRIYWVEEGTVPMHRYALSAVKRVTLVKGIHHRHPRIWDGIWGQTFAVGHYDIGSNVFHREKQWCHRLWVPTGYKVTVTRKGWWDSDTPRVYTYTQGDHDISYGFFFGIGDTPIVSIDVVAV
jgi:hypothetical protein